jgi:UDP-N-acetyl-D-mannosaminuronic acid dehydrogenase
MNNLNFLKEKIQNRQAKLAVIGLGYVGLPVACMFADQGFSVLGVDIKPERVEQINQGHCPIEGFEPGLPELLEKVIAAGLLRATTDYRELDDRDVVLIDVETPTDDQHIPQYVALRNACVSLGKVLKKGALVIVESTIAPGTMEKVVQPLLEDASGLKSNQDFFLGVCPERVMPGKLLDNLKGMSRVCGGETPQVAEVLQLLYRHIVQADLDTADLITAELTKTAENTYRDVNIAFANELALICQANGANFLQVRELVNKSPGRQVLLAGAGVGGHCIPKDPWLLAYSAKGKVDLQLIPAARSVNDSMPLHMADLLADAWEEVGTLPAHLKVAILGYAYLENSDDTRNSPSAVLEKHLLNLGYQVVVHDPIVKAYQADVYILIESCDALVLMVAHQAYQDLDLQMVIDQMRTPIIVDGRFMVNASDAQQLGFIYRGVGWGHKTHESDFG